MASLKIGKQSKEQEERKECWLGRKEGLLVRRTGRLGRQAARQARRVKDEPVVGGTGRRDQDRRKDAVRRLLFYYY